MKDLSIEEKAKAYDEAIKKAEVLYKTAEPMSGCNVLLETVFPELKESEDEKIRKEMIFYFQEEIPQCSIQEHSDKMREFISWLKRQEIECIKLELKAGNSYFCYKSRWERADNETFKKGLIYKCNKDGVLDNFVIKNPEQHFIEIKDERIAWLEKQGAYAISWNENTDDNKPQKNHSVLIKTTHGNAEGEWNGKEWIQYRWSCKIKDSNVLYWMNLSELEKQGEQRSDDIDNKFIRMRETKPANIAEFLDRLTTVEQEFLWEHIAKIRELDKEEQKLVVIIPKFRIGDYVKNVNDKREPIYEIVYMDKECYVCEYRGKENMGDKAVMHFAFDNPYLRLVEQKPADNIEKPWSEEDEDYFDAIIAKLEITQDDALLTDNQMNFLKSLKDRVQPQTTWKPSDEQMTQLKKYCPDNRPLTSLYEQLKKLKA